MLVAAAVCPQTPTLVPEISGGAAEELADLRKASLDAVTRLGTERPDLLVVLAPGVGTGARKAPLQGTFRRFGVDLAVGGGTTSGGDRTTDGHETTGTGGADSGAELCCGLLVGSWLLDDALTSAAPAREGWEIGEETEPQECARLGRELARRAERVAFLVMADGSARRTLKAPGYLDDRAEPFDDEIARALAVADTTTLAAIDPMAASDLMAAGRAPWQALAAAAQAAVEGGADGRPWRGELLAYGAPYGVGYYAALWTVDRPAAGAAAD